MSMWKDVTSIHKRHLGLGNVPCYSKLLKTNGGCEGSVQTVQQNVACVIFPTFFFCTYEELT